MHLSEGEKFILGADYNVWSTPAWYRATWHNWPALLRLKSCILALPLPGASTIALLKYVK